VNLYSHCYDCIVVMHVHDLRGDGKGIDIQMLTMSWDAYPQTVITAVI